MIHNRCVCRCKLVIDLASKVFFLMWKHICNHFNTSPGILFEIGAPYLENEAWRWQRSLRPVYKSNSGAWAPRSFNDTINRSSIQFNIVFCPLAVAVSSDTFVGTHWCQAKLCQENFLSRRWLMGDGWCEEQGESPVEPALHLANGDMKLIFHIPYISTNNWLVGHGVSEGCCFPASPSLRPRIHISAPEIVFSDLSVGWWVLFCPTQRCPDVNNIQTKTRTALINTSWFVSGSSKAAVNNLEKRIRSNLKQASLSGKQLSASLIAWKNIFSAQLHFSDAFYVAAHVTPHEDEWAQMWFEHLTSSIHTPSCVFSSLMLRQSLISQADKRMEWAFPRGWQIPIKFKCWSYCLDYKLWRAESARAFGFAKTPWVQEGTEVPMCHCCKVSSYYAVAEAWNLNTDLCFVHAGEGCCGLWCPGPLLLYGGWTRRAQHIWSLPWIACET